MVNILEMSNEEYKSKCKEITIRYGRHETPFGECLIGITGVEKAVCFFWFVDDNFDECLEILRKEWPQAKLSEDQTDTAKIAKQMFSNVEREKLSVLLRGTEFQIKVWKALMKIPPGEVTTYSKIAEEIGHPTGIRAAGTAMKNNRIGLLVPCHRVTAKNGVNKYTWGSDRRTKIMEFEKQKKW
ncbi:regulatory protein ada [Venturia canescens]|uniref:regulatory protein ada n=1 Tax=Venturia canescens TaxID=32260 RepID=UPI001C9C8189|nr:regulatory protein ada [Venturia canescens]